MSLNLSVGELPTGFTVSTALNGLANTPPGLPDDYHGDGDHYNDEEEKDHNDYDMHTRFPDDNNKNYFHDFFFK